MIFPITEEMLTELKAKDDRLACVIHHVGMIEREVFDDLFIALVHSIVSQQISNAALQTVWKRLCICVGVITPEAICACSEDSLRQCGLSLRKVEWLKEMSQKVLDQSFDLESIYSMSDEEAIETLIQLKGIGRWSAEMICIFALQRVNILSLDDLGIRKGLCRLYHLDTLTKKQGRMFQQRFAPYNTIASFYLWYVGNLKEWDEKNEPFVL